MHLGLFCTNVIAATEGYYTYSVSNNQATITTVNKEINGSISIPSSLGGYTVTKIGVGAFRNCSKLTSIYIPSTISVISGSAFDSCSRLTTITIPDSVTIIDDYAFKNCDALKSVTIGKGVTALGTFAFAHCNSLTSIFIPKNVTSIESYAFYSCDQLKSVIILGPISSISSYTFDFCIKLESITFPNSVKKIGIDAFGNCDSLTDVWYMGSLQDKNNITINSYNNKLKDATWHYNYNICGSGQNYDSACDTNCNYCGYSRTAPHSWNTKYSKKDGYHWIECRLCNIKQPNTYELHSYDNSLDIECICGSLRPLPPTVSDLAATAVTLLAITNGEYSIDGLNWQKSNMFTNLTPNYTYTFFQRYAKNGATEASNKSGGTTITTDKITPNAPDAPIMLYRTHNSITLVANSAYEYSLDGENWQTDNKFENLVSDTTYNFYQRYTQTDKQHTSAASLPLTISTLTKPLYGDSNDNKIVDAEDALLVLHSTVNKITFSIEQIQLSDVDGDGEITATDALLILHYSVDKIDKFPVEQ